VLRLVLSRVLLLVMDRVPLQVPLPAQFPAPPRAPVLARHQVHLHQHRLVALPAPARVSRRHFKVSKLQVKYPAHPLVRVRRQVLRPALLPAPDLAQLPAPLLALPLVQAPVPLPVWLRALPQAKVPAPRPAVLRACLRALDQVLLQAEARAVRLVLSLLLVQVLILLQDLVFVPVSLLVHFLVALPVLDRVLDPVPYLVLSPVLPPVSFRVPFPLHLQVWCLAPDLVQDLALPQARLPVLHPVLPRVPYLVQPRVAHLRDHVTLSKLISTRMMMVFPLMGANTLLTNGKTLVSL
jgi:hypothetical protein